MRGRAPFLVLAMILAGVTAPVQAQEGTHCTAELDIDLSPGIGSEPSSGTFHSDGESGTFSCDGGGEGTIGVDGRYGTKDGDSCSAGGEGWGVQSLTTDGESAKNTITFEFGGLKGGLVNGTFEGEHFSGTFVFTPTEGDCVTSPATKGNVTLDGTMS
ncbi:MAG: hypothetical protein ACRDZ3_03870 [Acidimicrobiia bacterium]